MKKYYIGYNDNKGIFVILATTTSRAVAMFIRDSYRTAYKNIGLESELLIFNEESLPGKHRHTQD